ncbi:MAG: pentapeptide repeat-containing protein [Microcoleaceae cyanobacterium]
MASPTVGQSDHSTDTSWTTQVRQVPLWVRRWGAWTVEISLVVTSGLVPLTVGALCNRSPQNVPLNPVLKATSETVAATLAIPVRDRNPQVTTLTNFFWSAALLTPMIVGGWQLYLLARSGQTIPKRWFGIQVVNDNSQAPPSLLRVFYRESVGRWGIPLGIAYTVWRFTGAFPNLLLFVGLSGVMLLVDGLIGKRFNGRTGHDLLAGTSVREAGLPFQTNPFTSYDLMDDQDAVHAIIHQPRFKAFQTSLWAWMQQRPGMTLLIVGGASLAAVLGTFVGTQVYIQSQANRREFQHQDNEVFLALITKLSPSAPTDPAQRRGAILALGTLQDPRAIPLLTDLLAQESNEMLLDVTQQALVSTGPEALPYLARLNQALKNDLDSMEFGANSEEKLLVSQRLQATQRAIAKILKVYGGSIEQADLSQIDLSQETSPATQFSLVLDKTDLSGLNFRGSLLNNASLKSSSFYSAGEDGRYQTYDDWIADLSGADLRGADLTSAFLSRVFMKRTNFLNATLNQANLTESDLLGANFSSAKLLGTNLESANLKDAKFTGADLANANLSNGNLELARMKEASAQGALFISTNLKNADLTASDLAGADFQRANLRNSNLTSAQLLGANLANAKLQNANLQNANLSLVNLKGAKLRGANFSGVIFTSEPVNPEDQFITSPELTESNRFKGVNFSQVQNLDSNQITYICNQGGSHPDCSQ